jgi:hypothetical protein
MRWRFLHKRTNLIWTSSKSRRSRCQQNRRKRKAERRGQEAGGRKPNYFSGSGVLPFSFPFARAKLNNIQAKAMPGLIKIT